MKIKYPWKQALITGLAVALFALASFSIIDGFNRHSGWGINPAVIRGIIGLVTLLILGTGIYIGMQSAKQSNKGRITYGQALVSGIIVAVTTGVLVAIFSYIFCEYINPGYAAYMVEEARKAMVAAGHGNAAIDVNISVLREQYSTGGQVIQSLVGQSVMGTLISLIMALFVRTKK